MSISHLTSTGLSNVKVNFNLYVTNGNMQYNNT